MAGPERDASIGAAVAEAAGGPAARYEPDTEADPLIREHITRDPTTGDAVFRAMDYPVWAVVLNLRASSYDWEEVHRTFPELPRPALRAAERFWQQYPDEIRTYFDAYHE